MIMEGGFSAWMNKHYPAAIQLVLNTDEHFDITGKEITADELFQVTNNEDHEHVIIDVRSSPKFSEAHIEKAISIPFVPINEFVVGIEERNFARNRPLVVYCDAQTCGTAEKAAEVLLRNYYTEVYLLKEGIEGWYKRNYPIEYTN